MQRLSAVPPLTDAQKMISYIENMEHALILLFRAINYEKDELIKLIEERQNCPSNVPQIDHNIIKITDNISFHENSERILSGAILQFAKQGISIVHKNPKNCPPGRKVGSQDLRNVIWQARNHAMHYEESPKHKPEVLECFKTLELDFGPQFSLYAHPGVNLSKEVVEVLSWHGFETFREDMLLLS